MLTKTLQHARRADPAQGRWNVDGDEAVMWVDSSSLAIGAALEVNGNIIEDICWQQQNECSHINLTCALRIKSRCSLEGEEADVDN